jgi:hypothetical protein
VQDVRANYVCIHKGELAATVYSSAWEPWQVILHGGFTGILTAEFFESPFEAMCRAEEMISGASTKPAQSVRLPFAYELHR